MTTRRQRRKERLAKERAYSYPQDGVMSTLETSFLESTFDGISLTQAIIEGYGDRAVSQEYLDGLTRATLSDFRANISYDIAVCIGIINLGSPEAPIFEERFELKKQYALVSEGLVKGLIEYINYVRAKIAYNVQTAGQETTVPAFTTIPGTTIPPATTIPPVVTTTIPPGTQLVLDLYPGAIGAYSARKLRSAQTVCLRARRGNDNAEQDFGFVGGVLDTASIVTFSQGGHVFVTKWYDQSGSGNDIISPDPQYQPYIVVTGILRVTNGKATIDLDTNAVARNLAFPPGFLNGAANLSYFQVAKITEYGNSNSGVFGPSNTNSVGLEILQTSISPVFRRTVLRINGVLRNNVAGEVSELWNDATQSLTSIFGNPTDVSAYKNGSAVSLSDASPMPPLNYNGIYDLGYYNAGANNMYGDIQEVIIYNTNQKPNRVAIEANIKAYYAVPFYDVSSGLTNVNNVWSSGGGQGLGLRSTKFSANSRYRYYCRMEADSGACLLGLYTSPQVTTFANFVFGCGVSGGRIYVINNGAAQDVGAAPVGAWLAIHVNNGVCEIQYSTDEITWGLVWNLASVHNVDLWGVCDVGASSKVYYPKAGAVSSPVDFSGQSGIYLESPEIWGVPSNSLSNNSIGNGIIFPYQGKFRVYCKVNSSAFYLFFGLSYSNASGVFAHYFKVNSAVSDMAISSPGGGETPFVGELDMWYGLYCNNGVIKFQKSVDGISWVDVHTFPDVLTANVYVLTSIYGYASIKMSYPRYDGDYLPR